MAGVDLAYDDEPTNWLSPPPAKQTQKTVASPQQTEVATPLSLPNSHDEFLTWLAQSEAAPGAQWGQKRISPRGPLKPALMVISAVPEPSDIDSGTLFSGAVGELLEKMMRAVGSAIDHCYLASLSTTRAPTGQIDAASMQHCKEIMLHHIDLVSPKKIILLGDNASQTLLGTNLISSRQSKPFVNHNVSKTEAIATFHPRILLERPQLKREAWKDLQSLLED